MKYLLYCISERPPQDGREVPLGIDGRPVYLLEKNGICAVVSAIEEAGPPEDAPSAMTFHKVIEFFNLRSTVIPLRFGAYLDKEIEIARLLERQGRKYERLLNELSGAVEMGIRIVIRKLTGPVALAPGAVQAASSESDNSGESYLKRRKAHYELESMKAEELKSLEIICRTAFDGLYIKFKSEVSLPGSGLTAKRDLVSFYFLSPRGSIEEFRQTYVGFKGRLDAKSMLSGPWPPYNFVLPTDFTECEIGTRRV
jgi:hypothetical protein